MTTTTDEVDRSISISVNEIADAIEADPGLCLHDRVHEEADYTVAHTNQSALLAYLADRNPTDMVLGDLRFHLDNNPGLWNWSDVVDVAAFLTVENELYRRLNDECEYVEHGEVVPEVVDGGI